MKTTTTRRHFTGSVSAAALLQAAGITALPAAASAAGANSTVGTTRASAALVAQPLAEGVIWIRGAGANLLALKDPQGIVFIDGGRKEHADAVLRLAQNQLGRGPAHTLINTHWHAGQTGLNEKLGKAGAKIIAHENTRLWLSTTVRYQPDGPPIRPLPKVAQPNQTSWGAGELVAGNETLTYAPMSQAHTDGDLYVKLARANVLVTGGVVAGNGWPIPDWVTGGSITGLAAAYRTLVAQCDDATRVVTAFGDKLYTKADLQTELEIITRISGELSRMMRAGFGPADVLAAEPLKEHAARLGDPTEFLVESFKSLWPRLAPDA